MVSICEGPTQSVGKNSLLMHRETDVFLWDEYAPEKAELIQVYSDKTVLCPRAILHLPIFLLDADGASPEAIKSVNVSGLFSDYYFSPSASSYHIHVIYQSGPDPLKDLHVHEFTPF